MHREHEELMRREFFEQAQLGRTQAQTRSDYQYERLAVARAEYDDRWLAGPHADQWAFLSASYDDWQRAPKTMAKFMDNLDRIRAHPGFDFTVTDVQRRSLEQARDLVTIDHTRPPAEHEHGIEWGR
ncbi:hypothetical protein ACFXHA_38865 [Nocardia sp. NPDC059240]|uniref:hypothetical protein n=1 Tax=Nocardia sp. NPDC059240 TaxID=3346786 RepID=UPI003677B482